MIAEAAPGDGWPEITRSRKGWFNIGNASGKTRMASAGLVIARMIEPPAGEAEARESKSPITMKGGPLSRRR
jgi:hypothetical protein